MPSIAIARPARRCAPSSGRLIARATSGVAVRSGRWEAASVSADQVILSCALTGAVTTKQHCPAIPYTPVEIAEEARRAYEAGAAIVHIHARNDDGSPTWSTDTFAKIM